MPETTVHEYHGVVPRKHNVGLSRQFTAVKPEAVAQPVDHPANHQLGTSVLATDEAHPRAALLRRQRVGHWLSTAGVFRQLPPAV